MKGEVCKIGFARCSIYALICRQNVLEMVHRVKSPAMDST